MNATVVEQTPTIGLNLTLSLLSISVVISIVFVVGFLKLIKKK